MQEPLVKLDEIIWEITGRCDNRCDYCGSKDQWNQKIDSDRILQIAEEIAKYPPKQIDISGGDPMLVPFITHKLIIEALKKAGVYCKVLLNPKSIKNNPEEVYNILMEYDYVGLSVNTKDDIEIAKKFNVLDKLKGKVTMITNFNTDNIFLFDEFVNFLRDNGSPSVYNIKDADQIPWMVQYTVYKNQNEPKAIYNNDQAFEYFKTKLSDYKNIIPSDNLTDNACGAGRNGIGILSTGEVVPCLSMRSWVDDIKSVSQGNILTKPLKEIWENEFLDYRVRSFKCCKDHCNNKCLGRYVSTEFTDKLKKMVKTPTEMVQDLFKGIPQPPTFAPTMPLPPNIFSYGTVSPVYPQGTFIYSVPTGNGCGTVSSSNVPGTSSITTTKPDPKTMKLVYGVPRSMKKNAMPDGPIATYYMVQTVASTDDYEFQVYKTEDKDKKDEN